MRFSVQLAAAMFPLALCVRPAFAAKDVPVPAQCTPQVNQGLQNLIASHTKADVDNVMVCGIATQKTYVQPGGAHGDHHVTTVAVQLPNGKKVNVQVVSNDMLDGVVVANVGNPVFAYGQGYNMHGQWVAGVHDVHCSTHPSADNGWVVVNGVKKPTSCPSAR